MQERRHWTEAQDNLIKESIQFNANTKWSKLLKWIKLKHPQFSRTPKQMRQRWMFHLNPVLSNQAFTEQEEELIFKSHVLLGSKWKQIQKKLPARSEKSIKNFFYMTLRKSVRRVTKIIGVKNSTKQSRQIKPQVLSKLIQSYNEQPQKRQAVYQLFRLHKIKSGDCKKEKKNNIYFQTFRQLVDDMTKINQLYLINKKQGLMILQQKILIGKSDNSLIDKSIDRSTLHSTNPTVEQDANEDQIEFIDQSQDDSKSQISKQNNSLQSIKDYQLQFFQPEFNSVFYPT